MAVAPVASSRQLYVGDVPAAQSGVSQLRDKEMTMTDASVHIAANTRYDSMEYRRTGRSGLKLPAVSLGLWHNFGDDRALRPSGPSCAAPSTWA